jgi:predicted RNase H-like HicB family nuclease
MLTPPPVPACTAPVYTAIVRPAEKGGYWAKCDAPGGGCVTQGKTLWETKKNMFEAMAFYLEDYPDVMDYDLAFDVQNA